MQTAYCPRLSDAKDLLPLLRAQLVASASRYSLPVGVSVDLLPIVENGLFGYELVPNRQTHTYLMVGFNQVGEAITRKTHYSADAPGALRLATANGEVVTLRDSVRGTFSQQRETRCNEIAAAVDSAFSQLVAIFPEQSGQAIDLEPGWHRYLDEALNIADSHLSKWNPFIHFFGLPLEAEFGFALRGEHGEHGALVCRRPDMWVLRWKSPEATIFEEWAVVLPEVDGRGAVRA